MEAFSYSPPLEGLGVVSEELKVVFRCRFFFVGVFFWVGEKKRWTFLVTCMKPAFYSSETTPDPSKGGEYSPPLEAYFYSLPKAAYVYVSLLVVFFLFVFFWGRGVYVGGFVV
ncbi:MAG: hypothetical protein LBC74_04550 [Planctomycetaceae bacterium]|nr:hypothetical protein [Planctomycetaceae bacterium]